MGVRFQPPSKSLTPRDYQFVALVILLFLLLMTLLTFANLQFKGGGGDFFVHWAGSRAYLFDRMEPYSGQVPAQVQQLVYERPAKAGDEPYILDTPFHILPFYFPFSLPSDPMPARAIFTAFLELALFAAVFLSLRLTDWKTPRVFSILFMLFGIFNFYAFQAIYEASPVLFLGLLYAGLLLSLRAETDELTGALIAVSVYYWEVGGPFLLLVILRTIHEKRVRVLAGFFMVTFVLLVISFFLYPAWIIPFLRAAVNNLRADFGFNLFAIFDHFWPAIGPVFPRGLIILVVVILGYEWRIARGADFRRFHWACCATLAATPLLGVRTEMEHLIALVLPLALVFAVVHDRWRRMGDGLTIFLLLLVFAIPWLLNFFAVERFGRTAQEVLFLFLPVFTLAGLYWIRWWALHPPRTWVDLANRS